VTGMLISGYRMLRIAWDRQQGRSTSLVGFCWQVTQTIMILNGGVPTYTLIKSMKWGQQACLLCVKKIPLLLFPRDFHLGMLVLGSHAASSNASLDYRRRKAPDNFTDYHVISLDFIMMDKDDLMTGLEDGGCLGTKNPNLIMFNM